MKTKLISLTFALVALAGCKKEEEIIPTDPCMCGVVNADGYGNGYYWAEVINDCTNHTRIFTITKSEWIGMSKGDKYCSSIEW